MMHLFWLPKIYIGNRHLQRYCCYWSLLGLLEIIVWVAWQRLNGSWYLAARVPANKRTLLLRCRFHTRSKETVSILYEFWFILRETFSSNYNNNNNTSVLILTYNVSFSDAGCMNTVKHKPGLQLQYLLQGGSYRNTKLRKYLFNAI